MDVLVLDTDGEAGLDAERRLEDAGHRVHRCHPAGAAAFPCAALAAPSGCPLDGAGVDAAVVVRHEASMTTTAFEDGVTCTARHRVPLVVAGASGTHPFADWSAATIDGTAGVVEACEEVATGRLTRHEQVAVEMLEATLAEHGVAADGASAEVRRRDGTLVVSLRARGLDTRLRSMVATRVGGELRVWDRHTGRIEIAVAVDDDEG
jgi:hypothetical protein